MENNTALATAQENMVAEISPFQARANDLLARAKTAKVTDEKTAAEAVALKKEITAHRTLVNRTRLGITRQIDSLKKAIMGKEAEVLAPLEDAQDAVGGQLLTYQDELERNRREEQERIEKCIQRVSAGNVYGYKTVAEVDSRGEQIKGIYKAMPLADQTDSQIKLAFTEAINKLIDRKTYLVEQAKQEAERAELDAKEAKQAAKQRRLDEKEAKLQRQQEADELARKEADERMAKEQAEKNQVKTGARTVTTIDIINADLVPREYCSPDMSKIRQANHGGATIPGIKVTITKKI